MQRGAGLRTRGLEILSILQLKPRPSSTVSSLCSIYKHKADCVNVGVRAVQVTVATEHAHPPSIVDGSTSFAYGRRQAQLQELEQKSRSLTCSAQPHISTCVFSSDTS